MRVSLNCFLQKKKSFCLYKNLVKCYISYINWYVLVAFLKIAYWTISLHSVQTQLVERITVASSAGIFFERNITYFLACGFSNLIFICGISQFKYANVTVTFVLFQQVCYHGLSFFRKAFNLKPALILRR